jgi:23S rRNA (cytosine1962-C5)-methyltransferase
MKSYRLIDSGEQKKLEQFGPYKIIRPAPQALWAPSLRQEEWVSADALFDREKGNRWRKKNVPSSWEVEHGGLVFRLSLTDFGHLGLFPEQVEQWRWLARKCRGRRVKVLNLFAYSGGATLVLAKEGASVCHLDASKGMVEWAKKNAALNRLEREPIRWIVDDALKFLHRESKRGAHYDGIILDPPTFGRGSQGQVFKVERDIGKLLDLCKHVLIPRPLFLLFTSHTPGFAPLILSHLLQPLVKGGKLESDEMVIPSKATGSLPSGSYARWSSDG